MPVYEVTERTFWAGSLYGPDERRTHVVTDKPIKPLPEHFIPVKGKEATQVKQSQPDVAGVKKAVEADHDAIKGASVLPDNEPESL